MALLLRLALAYDGPGFNPFHFPRMMDRLKHNVIGIIGLLGCLVCAGIDTTKIVLRGVEDSSPLLWLAELAAGRFAPPASAISAGSEHDRLALAFYLYAYVALNLAFALLYWWRTALAARHQYSSGGGARGAALLAPQILIGLACSQGLLYLVAAELAFVLPLRSGLRWLAAQVALVYLVSALGRLTGDDAPADHWARVFLVGLAMMAAWQGIAFAIGRMAAVERRGRIELAGANAELRATQLLWSDTVRASERMRIARDLHDIVGHHLTALNLHLDLAQRQWQGRGQAPAALATARALAQSLLTEVRAVVGVERQQQQIDLRQALEALCAGIPAPRIELRFDAALEINSAAVAHALFCCVQEAISNAVRHAGASVLRIELLRRGGDIAVLLADDGPGAAPPRPEGNGLRGMRERLAQLGGRLSTCHHPQRGFSIEIELPAAGAPA
jgi:signal transduction histidine kinase